MALVTVQAAKTHLSRLLRRVEAGEEVVIARGQTPVARLVPYGEPERAGRLFGAARGLYGDPPDGAFDPLSDDELVDWE
jgi:prevent-host-death family protein